MVGDFKWLENGLLKFKTDYSWGYFTIDYDEVSELTIVPKCKILITSGIERIGYIRSNGPDEVIITSQDTIVENYKLHDLVNIETIFDNFLRKFRGLIEFGFNLTKANNNRQLSLGADVSYIDEKWFYTGKANVLNSRQDGAEEIDRSDANLSALRLLYKKWFATANVQFLSNTEQAVKFRITPNLAVGNLLVYNPKMYLGLYLGVNANFEEFTNNTDAKQSSELLMGVDMNMFNFEDIRISGALLAYQGLTESRRFRADFDINLRLSLISDFYLTVGLTVNYDNQSAVVDSRFDYILKTGLGYKINY